MHKICKVCGKYKPMHSRATTCSDCVSSGLKWCKVCERTLPTSGFTKGNSGYWHICKECHNAAHRKANMTEEQVLKRNEYSKAYMAEQRLSDEGRMKQNDAVARCLSKKEKTEQTRRKNAERMRKYRLTPAGKQQLANSRSKRRNAHGVVSAKEWECILYIFDNSCAYCGSSSNITIDHVTPIANGGFNVPSNVVPACIHCNSSKNASDMLTWYKKQPFFSSERLELILRHTKGGA